MFLVTKMVYNTFDSVMTGAGSNQTNFMGPAPYRSSQMPTNVEMVPAKKKNLKVYPVTNFGKVEETNIHLGPDPIFITCPSCSELMTTKVVYEKGENQRKRPYLMCYSNSTKDALHYCPSCHVFLGKYVP